jgi:hypothetical protein
MLVAEDAAVTEQGCDGYEEKKEVEMVISADAVVDPDTMVVLALDAGAAERAVF